MQNAYNTGTLYNDITHEYETIEELKAAFMPRLQDQRKMWQAEMETIFTSSGLSMAKFAKLCGVSAPAVRKWLDGSVPQRRDTFIRIGFAAGYDLDQMNRFLQRYGRCPQLYVKSLEDSICIHVLSSKTLPRDYATYEALLKSMQEAIAGVEDCSEGIRDTEDLMESFRQLDSTEALEAFIRKNAASYRAAYHRLYDYILENLEVNRESWDGDRLTLEEMAEINHWSSSLRHCISAIRSKRWFPQRSKIISLGLHLNMDDEQINEMLRRAQMEPLCAKYPAEAVLLFGLVLQYRKEEFCQDGDTKLLEDIRALLAEANLEDTDFLADNL